jgi:hypothetical protein
MVEISDPTEYERSCTQTHGPFSLCELGAMGKAVADVCGITAKLERGQWHMSADRRPSADASFQYTVK